MKHLKKLLLPIIALAALVGVVYSGPLGVNNINIEDENSIRVTLSENPNIGIGEIDAEVTILHDVKIRGGFLNESTTNEVELLLEDAILPNTSYSLLTVLGSEGSIDFVTPAGVEGFTADNLSSVEDQDIESIEIMDDRTILITYMDDLTSSSYEYKLLAESNVVTVEKPTYDDAELIISTVPPLKPNQDYILMFIEMQDVDGNYIEFDTGIYDFSTPETEETAETGTGETVEETETGTGELIPEITETGTGEVMEEETGTGELVESEDDVLSEMQAEENGWDESLEVDLEAAGSEASAGASEGETDTESVALGAESTPDTWAETWVLIALTLIINTFYYSARRKKQIVA